MTSNIFSNGLAGGILVLCLIFQPAFAAETSLRPESFFSIEGVSQASISPSGKQIAIVQNQDSKESVIAIIDSEDPAKFKVVAAEARDRKLPKLGWVNDKRIYYEVADSDGRRAMVTVNSDGTDSKTLEGFRHDDSSVSGFWGPMHDGSNNIIAETFSYKNSTGSVQATRLYKIDTLSLRETDWDEGKMPKHTTAWLLDRHDVPRIAQSKFDDKCASWYLDENTQTWGQIDEHNCFNEEGLVPFFLESEQKLYATRSDGGYSKLYAYDLKNHRAADQPLIDFKGFDFNGYFQYEYATGRILGVHYHTDANGVFWFDPEMKKAQQIIDQKLPATINTIYCGANCLSAPALLVVSTSDKQPNQYFIFRKSDNAVLGIGFNRPHIDPKQMGQRDFFRYKARDGMEIPVYVTQPPGPHADRLPAVVIVHGGPWLRGGSWEWDAEAQFLASRGYLVIQPEFRGSAGFGYAHLHAGYKQWGLSMQDDLTDAADWAVRKGWADPKRIGILGGSYGGYAALMGLIKTPEVFRCGVAFAAETDLHELLNSPINDISVETQEIDMKILVGDPDADEAMFKANSPLYHPDAIRKPLLMAHGALDRRVPIGNASSLVHKVKDNNENVEWIVYDDEGHGLAHEHNMIDFWTRVDLFLAKYLKPAL